jgi:hypothetical protein
MSITLRGHISPTSYINRNRPAGFGDQARTPPLVGVLRGARRGENGRGIRGRGGRRWRGWSSLVGGWMWIVPSSLTSAHHHHHAPPNACGFSAMEFSLLSPLIQLRSRGGERGGGRFLYWVRAGRENPPLLLADPVGGRRKTKRGKLCLFFGRRNSRWDTKLGKEKETVGDVGIWPTCQWRGGRLRGALIFSKIRQTETLSIR